MGLEKQKGFLGLIAHVQVWEKGNMVHWGTL